MAVAKITRAQAQTWLNAHAQDMFFIFIPDDPRGGRQVAGADVREYIDDLEFKLITLAGAVAQKEVDKNG